MRRKQGSTGGLSTGTWAMLIITLAVVLGCAALFPTLTGNVDVRVSPDEIAAALGSNIKSVTEAMSSGNDGASGSQTVSQAKNPITSASPTHNINEDDLVYVTPAPTELTPTAEPVRSFTLTAAGIIEIPKAMQKAMLTEKSNQFSQLLGSIQGELTGDMTLAALRHTVVSSNAASDINLPVGILPELRASGLNTLCYGFGGALSYGVEGAKTTQDTLTQMGFTAYGAYASQQARDALTIVNLRGVQVALLSYADDLSTTSRKQTSKEERVYALPDVTLAEIKTDVNRARQLGAQVVIASVCWGKEGASSPAKAQTALAQEIVNAGVDVILGTNSLAVQRVELLTSVWENGTKHQALCAYSLGTLVTASRNKRAQLAGMLMHLTINYEPLSQQCSFSDASYTPTYIWRTKEDGAYIFRVVRSDQPSPAAMEKDQVALMDKCLTMIDKVMADGALAKR